MDDYTPVIKKIQQIQQFDSNGKPYDAVRIDYMIGQHGPFSDTVSKIEFSSAKVQSLMQNNAATLRALGATSVQ